MQLVRDETIAFTAVPTPTDEELLQGIKHGNEDALAALYERYAGFVTAVAIRILGDRAIAEEVVQDTFLRCWQRAETFDAERGRVGAWLLSIARNRAIDVLRSRSSQARRRESEFIPDTSPSSAPEMIDAIAMRDVVARALKELSTEQRQVIELAYYGGLTQAEIARELGAPLGTVKTRARTALNKLRGSLRPYFVSSESDRGLARDQ